MRQDLFDQIAGHEGTGPMRGGRHFPYVDTVGKITVGYGRNITDKGISAAEASMLLEHDIEEALAGAESFPWFATLNPVRQKAIVDLVFNLGLTKFRKFVKTIASIEAGDFVQAGQQLQQSLWFRQVGRRGSRIVRMITTGEEIKT